MANLRYTARFKRDYRKGVAKGCDGEKLKALLELLRLDRPLPLGSRDAAAENAEVRSCRVEPGWQLAYRVKEGEVTLLRLKFARKERPKAAPPMALWFKTLLRSPVKTALTVLLLAVAAFLLLDNLSSYAMQTQAIKQAEEKVEGVLTVERSRVIRPVDGANSQFLFTDPTCPGQSYWESVSYETKHHEALSEEDLDNLEALPYIDGVDRRYMTAGVSEEYTRHDGPQANYGYMDRLVLEATVGSWDDFPDSAYTRPRPTIYDDDGLRIFYLADVELLAGDASILEFMKKIQRERTQNKIDFFVEWEHSVSNVLIPPLILQTFVENSIKYAVNDNKLFIILRGYEENGKLKIRISDTGQGFDEETLRNIRSFLETRVDEGRLGVGIVNTVQRMDILYQGEAELHVGNSPTGGAVTEICLPLRRHEDPCETKDREDG